MARAATLRVDGYREFMQATQRADKESKKFVRDTFRKVGESVLRDAQSSTARVHFKSAAGYKIRVRQTGIAVGQSLTRTTGEHGEWGSWQMRHALVPALYANEQKLMRDLEQALDVVADHFNEGP